MGGITLFDLRRPTVGAQGAGTIGVCRRRRERVAVELKKYSDIQPFPFGSLTIRDLTPGGVGGISLSDIEVPIGADTPPYAAVGNDKVYIGVSGEIEFAVDGKTVRVGRGDVLIVRVGEQFRYHNGAYRPGRLLLVQVPPRTAGSQNGGQEDSPAT
jgi:mannose-6-phosphate isomerase-like protein (cupin superfamily)